MRAGARIAAGIAGVLLLGGCGNYDEVEREIGHRGAARLNPFLAAERFLAEIGRECRVERGWPQLDRSVGLVFMPAGMLEARGYVDEVRDWVADGGHLVCLFAWSSSARDDWRSGQPPPQAPSGPLADWIDECGWTMDGEGEPVGDQSERWDFMGGEFAIEQVRTRRFMPAAGDGAARAFVSEYYGDGRLTLVGDARPFRNRYLGEGDHAPLLAGLAAVSRPGPAVIVLGTGVSFWRLLWANGWTVLIPLVLLALVWLWRALPRFGPVAVLSAIDERRDYRRHLDAVGGFFWRLRRSESLLVPLRREVAERLQRRRAAAGQDADVDELAETISGVPKDRVRAALEGKPGHDAATFTRVTADLQRLMKSL